MQTRVALGIVAIVALVGWLAWGGFQEGSSYYLTCDEVARMGDSLIDDPIRLAGNVVAGSIRNESGALRFELEYNGSTYAVRYTGNDPVPDTFKDGADAVVDGALGADGVFTGQKIQAKCASKYEVEYDSDDGTAKASGKTA